MIKKKILLIIIILVLYSSYSNNNSRDNLYIDSKIEIANINNISYNVILEDNELFVDNGKIKKLIEEKVLDMKIYNIDSTKNDELLVISMPHELITQNERKFGYDIIIFKLEETENIVSVDEIYRDNLSDINPWMIDAANIDGDNDTEIFVGVYKRTEFYEKERTRPFFYSWNGEKLYKKWTGSFFSKKELIDISFIDLFNGNEDETVVLEKDEEGRYTVSLYSWLSFGFVKVAESDFYYNATNINTVVIDDEHYIEIECINNGDTCKHLIKLADLQG